jgi:hypothetical protein
MPALPKRGTDSLYLRYRESRVGPRCGELKRSRQATPDQSWQTQRLSVISIAPCRLPLLIGLIVNRGADWFSRDVMAVLRYRRYVRRVDRYIFGVVGRDQGLSQ